QIAVPDEPLLHRGAIAQRKAVAPHPSNLEMCGAHHEYGSLPASGRKPLPGVGDVIRRMWTAVHPDLALLLHPLNLRIDLAEPLRGIVEVRCDAEIADAAESVGRWVWFALMFRQRQQ